MSAEGILLTCLASIFGWCFFTACSMLLLKWFSPKWTFYKGDDVWGSICLFIFWWAYLPVAGTIWMAMQTHQFIEKKKAAIAAARGATNAGITQRKI